MKKILCIVLSLISACMLISCSCEHEWIPANCLSPKTCSKCGETEGEALGHDWMDAICEKPKTCSRCGVTEGEPLGHDWEPATCETPRTCSRCGKTEGEPLGHQPGDWKVTSTNMVDATVTSKKYCDRCGKVLDTQTRELEQLFWNDEFMLSPEDYLQRISNELSKLADNHVGLTSIASEDVYAGIVTEAGDPVGHIMFIKDNNLIKSKDKNTPCFNKILCSVKRDSDITSRLLLSTFAASDPSLTENDLKDMGLLILINGVVERNEITYIFGPDPDEEDGNYIIAVSLIAP